MKINDVWSRKQEWVNDPSLFLIWGSVIYDRTYL